VRWATGALTLFLTGVAAQLAGAPTWLWWALYLACYLLGGWQPARDGLSALRSRTLDVDLLMIVAAVAAMAIGQIFDGALLIVIFATSGALEDAATQRTEDSVRGLLDLTPDRAARIAGDGTEHCVAAADLRVGDEVRVRPGEAISADGIILDGFSDIDQSSVTGEPLGVTRTVGDEVFAGTLNGSGVLHIRVLRDPTDTVVARIATLVGTAAATKAKTQLFIEKVERRYSVGVVIATLVLLTVPLALGADLRSALLRAMTFMIVASPCALMLATMPPLLSAIANAGRHGVLIKSAIAMERLADTTVVALDKTGTVTTGTPHLTAVTAIAGVDEHTVVQLAAAAEQFSEHPLAEAVVSAARDRSVAIPQADDFQALPGRGVRAVVSGRHIEVLNPRAAGGDAIPAVEDAARYGSTTAVVCVESEAVGVLTFRDTQRAGAREAITALGRLSARAPVLLSGDNAAAARTVGEQLGVDDTRADLLPQEKVSAVQELQRQGHRGLFVGDGINDAPAMATADSAIAMGRTGSDLALHTADAVIVRDELATIPAALDLARRARRVVIANLVIAGVFITGLVSWDLFGDLPLPLGVAGHEGSTIIVALNGLRLLHNRAWRMPTI